MIQAEVKPVDIAGMTSLEAEFQKMDAYYNEHGESALGIVLVQVRRILVDGKPTNKYHLAGQFVEHEQAKKIMEVMGK